MSPLDAILIGASCALATPAIVLGIETLVACVGGRPRRVATDSPRPSAAVLVPAHNEEAHIASTIESILPQLAPGDRLLVVADNCDDRTAEIARQLGAEVLERRNLEDRGKGYAIRHGLDALRQEPPAVVVNIDADCVAEPGSIEQIVALASRTRRPVQGSYVMRSPADGPARMSRVSEFAVLVKNRVRPLGLQRLGLPCLLTGSGMAFPWESLEKTPHPGSHIVEDMRFSTDLTMHGFPPKPCMEAEFLAWLPSVESAFVTQRTRWEHGHLATIRSEAPRLLWAFLTSGRWSPLALMLELAVPPLSLFAGFLLAVIAAAAVLGLGAGIWSPLWVSLGAGSFATVGVGAAWFRYGRDILPIGKVLSIPVYVLKKLPIYRAFVTGPEEGWVRTARDPNLTGPHFQAEEKGAPASVGEGQRS